MLKGSSSGLAHKVPDHVKDKKVFYFLNKNLRPTFEFGAWLRLAIFAVCSPNNLHNLYDLAASSPPIPFTMWTTRSKINYGQP